MTPHASWPVCIRPRRIFFTSCGSRAAWGSGVSAPTLVPIVVVASGRLPVTEVSHGKGILVQQAATAKECLS
jgi:hypothetical protein